jgi:16S rRNA (guanine(966)-N(2))-methyltransferase RsmD
MRIIAGELKGRRLASPSDKEIRPTADIVKEALFSMLAPYLEDAVVIDLFSGSGNVGLEAVSRGARRVYFGDKSRTAIELTKRNISYCKVEDRCVVIWGSWEQVLARIQEPADVIFLDPPYQSGLLESCIIKIGENSSLARDGIIAVEQDRQLILPDQIGPYHKERTRRYGKVFICFYREEATDTGDREDDPK